MSLDLLLEPLLFRRLLLLLLCLLLRYVFQRALALGVRALPYKCVTNTLPCSRGSSCATSSRSRSKVFLTMSLKNVPLSPSLSGEVSCGLFWMESAFSLIKVHSGCPQKLIWGNGKHSNMCTKSIMFCRRNVTESSSKHCKKVAKASLTCSWSFAEASPTHSGSMVKASPPPHRSLAEALPKPLRSVAKMVFQLLQAHEPSWGFHSLIQQKQL